jgi:hypothetical protein
VPALAVGPGFGQAAQGEGAADDEIAVAGDVRLDAVLAVIPKLAV